MASRQWSRVESDAQKQAAAKRYPRVTRRNRTKSHTNGGYIGSRFEASIFSNDPSFPASFKSVNIRDHYPKIDPQGDYVPRQPNTKVKVKKSSAPPPLSKVLKKAT